VKVDQGGFAKNAVIMSLAKMCSLLSLVCICGIILTGRMLGMRQFLSNSLFKFMKKTMHLSYLLVPLIAKSY
jgi:hypothetical protein